MPLPPMPPILPPQTVQRATTTSNATADIVVGSVVTKNVKAAFHIYEHLTVGESQAKWWDVGERLDIEVHSIVKQPHQSLAQSLCNEHPLISCDPKIFGGVPHLRDMRLSVGDILGQVYLSGSIEGVKEIYAPDVSEDQIKEAIAYAQDFIEAALSSRP